MQTIQKNNFPKNRFNGLWSSQRPPISNGLVLSFLCLTCPCFVRIWDCCTNIWVGCTGCWNRCTGRPRKWRGTSLANDRFQTATAQFSNCSWVSVPPEKINFTIQPGWAWSIHVVTVVIKICKFEDLFIIKIIPLEGDRRIFESSYKS